MRRVAEIIYLVESDREEFLKKALNPSEEELEVLWFCGVRKQQYFALNDLIFMTFEYEGNDFNEDMTKMAAYLDSKGMLVKKRRKDVPVEELKTTNWWAPIKRLGELLEVKPSTIQDYKSQIGYRDLVNGCMDFISTSNDIAYDDSEWTDKYGIL